MLCPRCGTETDQPFCPSCGVDLLLAQEVALLRRELQQLRAVLLPPDLPPGRDSPDRRESSAPAGKLPAGRPRPSPAGTRESAVGQKWFLALGVITLLLGAGFFLKYAFDEKWIGPALQVSTGFGAGLGMIGLGELCRRRRWQGLEIGLAAFGLGLLELSSYAASQVYGLLPVWLTLVLVLATAALGSLMASLWNSLLLAALSFFGGYLAPLLFLSGQTELFFAYLTVLSLVLQIIVFAKKWDSLYVLGCICTWIAFTLWHESHETSSFASQAFTHFVFFLYSLAPFLQAFGSRRRPRSIGFLVGLPNGLLCCGWSCHFSHYERAPSALVAVVYAILSLGLALALWRRPALSETAAWLLAEGAGFLLLAWVFLLSGYWITAFWAIQMVALFWVAAKSGEKVLLVSTIFVGWIVLIRFLLHETTALPDAFGPTEWSWHFAPMLLERYLTALLVLGGQFSIFYGSRGDLVRRFKLHRWFEFFGVISLFGFLNIELFRYADDYLPKGGMTAFSVLWALFASGLLAIGLWRRRKIYRFGAIGLLLLTAAKVLLLDTADFSAPYRIISCVVLGSILVCLSFLYYRYSDRLAGR